MFGLLMLIILAFLQEEGPSANQCIDASRSFLITCLTIDLVVVIICVVMNRRMNRRLVGYITSLVVPLILAFAVSSALVAWNPLKSESYLDCLGSATLARYVIMAGVADIPKGLVLGGAVSVVLYLLLVFVLGLIAKRK
jgi:hypothetical protein